jgi:hypothetical protein
MLKRRTFGDGERSFQRQQAHLLQILIASSTAREHEGSFAGEKPGAHGIQPGLHLFELEGAASKP